VKGGAWVKYTPPVLLLKRIGTIFAALSFAFLVLFGGPALAKKKKSTGPTISSPTVAAVVLPFIGQEAGGREVKNAVELELDRVENVQVKKSKLVELDLKKAGKKAFDPKRLAFILKKNKVDLLLRGERGAGPEGTEVVRVTAWGKDGAPRFFYAVGLTAAPDLKAKAIVEALTPSLVAWSSLPPLGEPPVAPARAVVPVEPPPVVALPETPVVAATPAEDPATAAPTRSIDDAERPAPAPERKPGHLFAISAAFDGGTWMYSIEGVPIPTPPETSFINAPFYPGGSVFLDAWPLAGLGVDWLGIDMELGVAGVPFQLDGQISPQQFTAIQTRGGAALKARLRLEGGFGIGLRAGYRYFGATTETQIEAGQNAVFTIVPGFDLHGASIGMELFLPTLLFDRPLEFEVRADGLPATFYSENPDNPGKNSLAFGWSASVAARYDIFSGVFFELRGHSTGLTATFDEQGERQTYFNNVLTPLSGGNVVNLMAGFSSGLGYMF